MKSILLVRTKAVPPAPPLGLISIASYLENNNYDVDVCDLAVDKENQLDKLLYSQRFSAVGISSSISTYYSDLEICQKIKDTLKIPIAVGGPHPSIAPEDYGEEFDFIVRGDGERALADIIENIEKNKKLKRIYRDLIDVSNLPKPARHLIDYKKYFVGVPDHEKRDYIFVSRGCPYSCIFCAGPNIFGRIPRYRNIDNVIAEIDEVNKVYDFKKIRIADDLFLSTKSYVTDFCKKLKKENLNVTLDCQGRINHISNDMLKTMRSVDFDGIFVGIESGSEETLRKIGKPFSLDKIKNTIDIIKKNDFFVTGSFTVGYPWEKKNDIRNTFLFAKELHLDRIRMYVVTPFKGTRLWEENQNKITTKNYNFYDTRHAVMNGDYLTANEIQGLYDDYCDLFNIDD